MEERVGRAHPQAYLSSPGPPGSVDPGACGGDGRVGERGALNHVCPLAPGAPEAEPAQGAGARACGGGGGGGGAAVAPWWAPLEMPKKRSYRILRLPGS